MTSRTAALVNTSGFADPGLGSQAIFRAAMEVLARPGSISVLPGLPIAPPPLSAAAAAVALALCDFETPIWLDEALTAEPGVADYLRFHTGARMVAEPREAAFAIAATPTRLPELAAFGLGTLDYPDRSTTLILQVAGLDDATGWHLSGPGIAESSRLRVMGLRPDFVAERQALAPLFPQGLDIIFVAGARLAALPRTTRVEA